MGHFVKLDHNAKREALTATTSKQRVNIPLSANGLVRVRIQAAPNQDDLAQVAFSKRMDSAPATMTPAQYLRPDGEPIEEIFAPDPQSTSVNLYYQRAASASANVDLILIIDGVTE